MTDRLSLANALAEANMTAARRSGSAGDGESVEMSQIGIGRICRWALSDGVPRRSLIVALFVGTILNLINQGDVVLRGMPPDLVKLALTYLVPYCVSTYGAVSYRLHAARHAAIAVDRGR